jgi:putative transposase
MPMNGSVGRGRVQSRDAGLSRTEADGHVWQDASCPAAWIIGKDSKTRELRSRFASRLRAPHADVHALITRAYLAGSNTRRMRRALSAVFAGPVYKDVVSRVCRKFSGDWDLPRNRRHVFPGVARFRADHHAQGGRSLAEKLSDR